MAQFKKMFYQDLTKRRIIQHCEDVVFTGDNLSDKIGVYLYDNGEPYAGGGTVSGTVINSRGQTVPITTGEISGNLVTVTLEEAALAVPGIIGVYVKLTSGQQIATVLGAMFTAMPTETDQAIDPGTIIPSVTQLITDIQTAVDSIPAEYTELLAAVAPTFSASTAYTAGSYVWHGGSLYRFTADHPAGTWTGTDAVQVSLADDLGQQVSDLRSASDALPYQNQYNYGDVTPNSYIGQNGTITANANFSITDYLPVSNGSYYSGIVTPGGSPYSAYYDASKGYITYFKQATGINTFSGIPARAKYVRMSIHKDDYHTFKYFYKNIAVDDDLEATKKAVEDETLRHSPNLFNKATAIDDSAIDFTSGNAGNIISYSDWFVSDYIPVTVGNDYMVVLNNSSDQMIVNGAINYAWYNTNYEYISGGTSISGTPPTLTAPSNAAYIRISKNTSKKNYMMFCKASDAGYYLNNAVNLPLYSYTAYGDYPKDAKPQITKIVNPFVFYQWNGKCYFRFDNIYYRDYDGTEVNYNFGGIFTSKYRQTGSATDNKIVATNTSRVRDCLLMASGYSFIYDVSVRQFVVTDSVDRDDIIMLACDANGLMSGVLFDAFNAQQSYYTARQMYHDMPISVINGVDGAISAAMIAMENERFVFASVADNHDVGVHIGKESNLTAMAIDYVNKRMTYDAILNVGDEILTISGGDIRVALSNAINAYDTDKLVFAEGNHDRGIESPVMTHKQYYNTVIRKWRDNSNVHTVYPHAYYYRDFPSHKIRIICLTPYDMPDDQQSQYPYNDYYGYNQAQMEWLVNTALRIESDWSVIIAVHSLPVTTAEGMTGNGSGGDNPLVLRQILESFKNGTDATVTHSSDVDYFDISISTNFASQGARKLIGVFGGHTHLDTIVKINNINYVATCCGYIDSNEYSGNRGNRNGLTYSAVCFDVGMIDQVNQSVTLYRVGFIPDGGSATRTFTY